MANFFESKTGKKVMAMAYGLGAAVVIVGALFKILHLPGADLHAYCRYGYRSIHICIICIRTLTRRMGLESCAS